MDKERDDRLAPVQPGHLSRHQRGLVEFGLALSRKDIEGLDNRDEFKAKILEALELLKNDCIYNLTCGKKLQVFLHWLSSVFL